MGFNRKDSFSILGIAVMVAPALALAATHVLSGWLEELGDGAAAGMCIGVRGEGLDLWKFRSISYDPADDVAFISLELTSPVSEDWCFSTLALTTRCPAEGEELTIVGFRFNDSGDFPADGSQPSPALGDLFAAKGTVSQVFPTGQDLVMVPFPAIEIQCGSRGAMSGGAVIDRDGLVLGVISTGWDTEDGEGPSVASWIVCGALGRTLDVPWPPGAYPEQVPVMEIPEAALRIVGRDAVNIDGNEMRYRIWY